MFNLLFFLVIFLEGKLGRLVVVVVDWCWFIYYLYILQTGYFITFTIKGVPVNTVCMKHFFLAIYVLGLICSSSYQYMQMGFFAKSNKATKRLHEWESKGHEK